MRSLVLSIVMVLGTLVPALASAERIVIEGILVRVNDRIVTASDFAERIRVELSQMPTAPRGEDLREFIEMILNEMVNELVLLERAAEKRLEVNDEMVDRAIDSLREENNLEDDEEFEQALASSGLTVELLRERYRRNMLLQQAVQGEVRPAEITEEELRQIYELEKEDYRVPAKFELEQIFLSSDENEGANTALMGRAQGLVDRVREGADLKAEATLAGAQLQELGAIPVADCRPELLTALEEVPDGGIADPLAVPGGIQIIRLVQRVPAGYQPFEDVVNQIRRQRSNESYESQTMGLVEKLRADYLVEVYEDRLEMVYQQLGGT